MSNEPYGLDTHINCPSCEDVSMLTIAGGRRKCPRCGYTEPHEPVTKTTTKDHTHG